LVLTLRQAGLGKRVRSVRKATSGAWRGYTMASGKRISRKDAFGSDGVLR
jgi:hypothetical protein